jgi:hypothetical protein
VLLPPPAAPPRLSSRPTSPGPRLGKFIRPFKTSYLKPAGDMMCRAVAAIHLFATTKATDSVRCLGKHTVAAPSCSSAVAASDAPLRLPSRHAFRDPQAPGLAFRLDHTKRAT